MDAGRELDALVAERVMGWKQIISPPYTPLWLTSDDYTTCDLPGWSQGWAAAGLVVERLIADGWTFELGHATGKDHSPWVAWLYHDEIDKLGRWGDTAPHAICLAAVAALEAAAE